LQGLVIEALVVVGRGCWGLVQVPGAHGTVVRGRVVLGEVIGKISVTRPPCNLVVALTDAVTDPIIPHVHRLGDASGGAIVGEDCRGMLGVPELLQGNTLGCGLPPIVEESGELGFGGTRQDFAYDFVRDIDGPVEWGCRVRRLAGLECRGWCAAEIMISSISGAGLALR
jgi:hypothetical protein